MTHFNFEDCLYTPGDFDDSESTPLMWCGLCECNVGTHYEDSGTGEYIGSVQGHHTVIDLVCDECGNDVSEKAREPVEEDEEEHDHA